MKPNPLSALVEGLWMPIRGVVACWAGLTWAYAITTRQWPWQLSWMEWLLGWMGAMVLPALATLSAPPDWWWLWMWLAWLLLPFALVMLRGALLKEWNLWIVVGLLATVAGGLGFSVLGIVAGWEEWPAPATLLAAALSATLFGTAQDLGWFPRLWSLLFPPPSKPSEPSE